MKCDKHPRYKVMRKPKPGCVICHAMWQEKLVAAERAEKYHRAAHAVKDMATLRHTLGVKLEDTSTDWGYRNYYCAHEGHHSYDALLRNEAAGLMVRGNGAYWHATEAGCRAVGLNEKQIKRALHDN